MSPKICFEDGPRDERDVGSTCILEDGHDSPHDFVPDDEIVISLVPRGLQP